DDHAVKRAGLDYWHLVELHRHLDWAHFQHDVGPRRCWLFTAHARRSWFDPAVVPSPGDALVFGRESVGLPAELVAAHPDDTVAIPTMLHAAGRLDGDES